MTNKTREINPNEYTKITFEPVSKITVKVEWFECCGGRWYKLCREYWATDLVAAEYGITFEE